MMDVIKYFFYTIVALFFNTNANADTWIDKNGLMDVSIDMLIGQPTFNHKVIIRDFNNFEYFEYIYKKIERGEFSEGNILQLRIGFEIENIATDFIPIKTSKVYEEKNHKVIEITTTNSLFSLNAFEFMLNAGARLKLSVSDNDKYFAVILNKWHEYNEKLSI